MLDITEGRMIAVTAGASVVGQRGVLKLKLGNEAEVIRGFCCRYLGTAQLDNDDLKNAPMAMVLGAGGTVKFLSDTNVEGSADPIPAGREVEVIPGATIVIGRQRPR